MLYLEHNFCGAEIRAIRKVDRKYVEGLEIWCWRRMETISWTDRVRNEEVLHRVKEELDILHTKQNSLDRAHLQWHLTSKTRC